jgi:hypothetical protein
MGGVDEWGSINIGVIDSLETQVFCAMVVRIFGSLGTQRISRVHLEIVERVMDGWMYAWACLMCSCMVAQLGICDTTMTGDFSFGSILCLFFLGEGDYVTPSGDIGSTFDA